MGELLPHIPPETLAEPFSKPVDFSDEAKALIEPGQTAEALLQTLIDGESYLDAIRLVARAVHPQYAVSWSRDCVRQAPPDEDEKKQRKARDLLDHVEEWLESPGDTPLRRDAMGAAEESGYDSAAAWVLASVGWSGGSIAPITAPPVEPPAGLCARAASGAIIITACIDPAKIQPTAKGFLDLGLEYAAMEPPEGGMPIAAIEPAPAAEEAPKPAPAEGEPEEPPPPRSLRRAPGVATAPEDYTVQEREAPPPRTLRSLRRKSDPPPPDRGRDRGDSGGGGGGWNPKPL